MKSQTPNTRPDETVGQPSRSHLLRRERPDVTALLMWFLGSFCFFFAFFQRVTPSIIVEDLMRDFGVTAGIVGTLSALYFYAYAGLQVPIGLLVDRWGPRYMLAGAIAINGLGTLLFAVTNEIGLAYIGRVLIGVGSAVGWVGSLKLIAAWFPPSRFALMSGCTSALGMTGAVIGQAPMAILVGAVGWRPALFGIGMFAVIYAFMLWLIVRDVPPGQPPSVATRFADVMEGLRGVAARPQTWIIAFCSGSMVAPQASFGALWGVPYLMTAHGIDRTTAAASTSMLLFGWAIGSPLAGWISDRIRRRQPALLIGTISAFGTMAAIVYIPDLPLTITQGLLLVNGIAGGSAVLCFVAVREVNDPHASGAAIGIVNMMTMLCGAVAQTAIGWLLDMVWNGNIETGVRVYEVADYHIAFLTLVVCGIAGVILALTMGETCTRQEVE